MTNLGKVGFAVVCLRSGLSSARIQIPDNESLRELETSVDLVADNSRHRRLSIVLQELEEALG